MKNNLLKCLFLFLAVNTQSFAQKITLVKDINLVPDLRNSNPMNLAVYRDTLYFSAQRDNTGAKLYKSDGTEAGTTLVGPSIGIDYVRDFLFYNNAFYFIYNDQIHGQELWVSDGTPAGTHVFLDLTPGAGSSDIAYLTICNNKLFFRATDGVDFNRLYASDGTVSGTKKLGVSANVFNGMNEFIVFRDKVYFPGGSPTVVRGLFVSDGTDAGTALVKEGFFGTLGGNFAVLNNKMYFGASDNVHGGELWESDGTGPNTQLFYNIAPNDNIGVQSNGGPNNLFEHAGTLYFAAFDGVHGSELWATDGTPANTRMVADLIPGDLSVAPQHFILYNNEVFFFGTMGGQQNLYKTDGTSGGTQLVKTFAGVSAFYEICIYHSLMYIGLGDGNGATVWVSDGTSAGTQPVSPTIYTLPTQEINLVEYKDELYLPAYTSATGMELFKFGGISTDLEEDQKVSTTILYPNPSNGNFILSGKSNIIELEACDAQGNRIEVERIGENCHLKTSARGIYFLRIHSGAYPAEVEKIEIR